MALQNGKQCLSGASCISGVCNLLGGAMRAACQARPQGSPCTDVAQCAAQCTNGRCDGNITPPPNSAADSLRSWSSGVLSLSLSLLTSAAAMFDGN